MVPIAIIYSRSEAMVVASLLEAAGILVHVGGYNHASVSIYPLALGGFRLTVPEFQHADASQVVFETPGFGQKNFCYGLQKAVLKFLMVWILIFGLPASIVMSLDEDGTPFSLIFAPLVALTVPVNPQGNSEYYLSKADN